VRSTGHHRHHIASPTAQSPRGWRRPERSGWDRLADRSGMLGAPTISAPSASVPVVAGTSTAVSATVPLKAESGEVLSFTAPAAIAPFTMRLQGPSIRHSQRAGVSYDHPRYRPAGHLLAMDDLRPRHATSMLDCYRGTPHRSGSWPCRITPAFARSTVLILVA
jgi:hypothetical protein